jgi:hypothetical protein
MAHKPSKAPRPVAAPSKGTTLASEVRAKANKLTDEQRQSLRIKGMQLIYGGGHGGKVTANCR